MTQDEAEKQMKKMILGGALQPSNIPPPPRPPGIEGTGQQQSPNVVTMGVERCENGFVLMSGGKKRIAADIEELTKQFVAMLVDRKLTE